MAAAKKNIPARYPQIRALGMFHLQNHIRARSKKNVYPHKILVLGGIDFCLLNKYAWHSCENRVMQSSPKVFLLFAVAICELSDFCQGGAPQTPLTQPYYPYEVSKGTYPCDWPGLKNASDPASVWAGSDFQHMRDTAPTLQNWPGLG